MQKWQHNPCRLTRSVITGFTPSKQPALSSCYVASGLRLHFDAVIISTDRDEYSLLHSRTSNMNLYITPVRLVDNQVKISRIQSSCGGRGRETLSRGSGFDADRLSPQRTKHLIRWRKDIKVAIMQHYLIS